MIQSFTEHTVDGLKGMAKSYLMGYDTFDACTRCFTSRYSAFS